MSTTNTNKTQEQETPVKGIIIEGVVTSAYKGKTKYSEEIKNRIAIKSESIPYDKITAFEESGNKLTPTWFKEKTGYINLTSRFDIPVMTIKGKKITFEEWLETKVVIGSTVKCKFIQKEGAIYPVAIKVVEDGEVFDAFEGL